MAISPFRWRSPLRYPGGKGRLAPFISRLMEQNNLTGGHYAEPYAGGAAIALTLLFDEYASVVHINDIDRGVFAFWHSVLNEPDELCRLITTYKVSVHNWRRQRAIQKEKASASLLELGFSTFFMNRTNRSGIITGGVIGGREQEGPFGIDARFNRADLVRRIKRVAGFRDRIRLSCDDAIVFLRRLETELPAKSITYCDPPYLVKGRTRLYANYYDEDAHEEIARELYGSFTRPWVVSYDYAPQIVRLYSESKRIVYDLNYSVRDRYRGKEVMIFGPRLRVPTVQHPAYLRSSGPRSRIAKSA